MTVHELIRCEGAFEEYRVSLTDQTALSGGKIDE